MRPLDYIDQICEETNSKKCNHCDKEFSSIDKFKQHNYRFHNPENSSLQKCEFCDSEFKKKYDLTSLLILVRFTGKKKENLNVTHVERLLEESFL